LNDLLPVPYYHVVFTLPDKIFPMCLFNQQAIYGLLFDCAAETLLSFGRDAKWMGGQIGFFGILHTWGQTMWMHPHGHFIVPGGGIKENGEWVTARHKHKFLFPVRALSKVFRGKFIEGLKEAYSKGNLSFPGELEELESREGFKAWVDDLRSNEWVVYSKPPFAGAEEVVSYVGRYTHRIAISNRRIISIDKGRVVFTYKDYTDNDKTKEMDLSADEFIRRFLWHVLPSGFHKIRHYGFLANGKKWKLKEILEYLVFEEEVSLQSRDKALDEGAEGIACPVCQTGRLRPIAVISRFGEVMIKDFLCLMEFIERQSWESSPQTALCFA
jgi:hypothetical protein